MKTPPFAEQDDHYAQVRNVLWVVLALNVMVGVIKIAVAVLTGSVAALAEVVHGVLDASANVIGLVGLAYAKEPPDERHPYGHQRFESLTALGIGVLIAAGLVEILRALWHVMGGLRPPPEVTLLSATMLGATIVFNFAISFYEGRQGRRLNSRLLKADAAHTLSDGMGVSIVLASFAGVHFGLWWADLAAAGIVAILIGRTALAVLRENAEALLDTAQLDPKQVFEIAISVPEVKGVHAIRSRGSAGRIHVDMHIQVDPQVTITEAHRVTHAVKRALQEAIPGVFDVVIHTEPADGRECEKNRGWGVPQ